MIGGNDDQGPIRATADYVDPLALDWSTLGAATLSLLQSIQSGSVFTCQANTLVRAFQDNWPAYASAVGHDGIQDNGIYDRNTQTALTIFRTAQAGKYGIDSTLSAITLPNPPTCGSSSTSIVSSKSTKYIPYVVGGAIVVGAIVLLYELGKKK